MGKGLSEILQRGDQEGVVVELSERGATVAERWNRRSRRLGSRMGGRGEGGEEGSADRSRSI